MVRPQVRIYCIYPEQVYAIALNLFDIPHTLLTLPLLQAVNYDSTTHSLNYNDPQYVCLTEKSAQTEMTSISSIFVPIFSNR